MKAIVASTKSSVGSGRLPDCTKRGSAGRGRKRKKGLSCLMEKMVHFLSHTLTAVSLHRDRRLFNLNTVQMFNKPNVGTNTVNAHPGDLFPGFSRISGVKIFELSHLVCRSVTSVEFPFSTRTKASEVSPQWPQLEDTKHAVRQTEIIPQLQKKKSDEKCKHAFIYFSGS